MEARRAMKDAKPARDQSAEAEAHHAVDKAKRASGERGPVWWKDGEPDLNRSAQTRLTLTAMRKQAVGKARPTASSIRGVRRNRYRGGRDLRGSPARNTHV